MPLSCWCGLSFPLFLTETELRLIDPIRHCVSPGESEVSDQQRCNRIDRDYDIGVRVGTLFAILVTSMIGRRHNSVPRRLFVLTMLQGVFSPIFLASYARNRRTRDAFMFVKQFGVGVIISTAFVHVSTHVQTCSLACIAVGV